MNLFLFLFFYSDDSPNKVQLCSPASSRQRVSWAVMTHFHPATDGVLRGAQHCGVRGMVFGVVSAGVKRTSLGWVTCGADLAAADICNGKDMRCGTQLHVCSRVNSVQLEVTHACTLLRPPNMYVNTNRQAGFQKRLGDCS